MAKYPPTSDRSAAAPLPSPSAQRRRVVAATAAIAIYVVVFWQIPLPDLSRTEPFRRADFTQLLTPSGFAQLLEGWFGQPAQFHLFDRLPLVLVAIVVWVAAGGLGHLILRFFRLPATLARAERWFFAQSIGLNALSTLVLLLGLAGQLTARWTLVAGLLALPMTALLVYRRWPMAAPAITPDQPTSDDGFLARHWLWFALPFVAVLVLGAMLPPTDFDVREYHLQVPKEFYLAGQITFLSHNVYGNMPLGSEMLSLACMIVAGDWWQGALAGKLAQAGFPLLTAWGLYLAGRRLFDATSGKLAALFYLSTPWVLHIAANGLIDTASAHYLLAACYAMYLAWPSQEAKAMPAGLAGYLAGAAVACKYPALLFVAAPLGLAVAVRCRRIQTWRPLLGFAVAALLGGGGWLIKNAWQAGNPFYPLFYDILGGHTWSTAQDARWNQVHRPHDFGLPGLGIDLMRVLLASPWLAAMAWPLAGASLLRDQRRAQRAAIVFLASYLAIWWLFTHRIDRFWIPLLPLVTLLAGAGFTWTQARLWRVSVTTMLIASLLPQWLMVASGVLADQRYFVSLSDARNHPLVHDPWRDYFNEPTHAGKLMIIGQAAVFEWRAPLLYNVCFNEPLLETWANSATSAELHRRLVAEQVRYIYVDWNEVARYRSAGNYGFTPFITEELFATLVAQEVLRPLPPLPEHAGRAYEVRPLP